MEEHWKNGNVDLAALSEHIAKFFEHRGFTSYVKKSGKDYHIIAKPSLHLKMVENIHVFVNGQPNDFTVRLVAGVHSHKLTMYGNLATLLGGGFFALKGLKSEEAVEKLDREFRIYVAAKIRQLENTASQAV